MEESGKQSISIIIPVYNVSAYIEKCARSLFEQTLTDIEYIFVDDCTPDDSIQKLNEVLSCYPERQESVKIISHKENRGQAAARKTGMEAVSGDYVIHCDSDDWVEPTMMQTLYEKALESDSDLVYCNFYKEYPGKSLISRHKKVPADKHDLMKFLFEENVYHFLWCCLAKRSIFTRNEFMFPTANSGEDAVLMTQLAYYSRKFDFIDTPLYHYRYNETSITADMSREKMLSRFEQVYDNTDLILDFLKQKGLEEEFRAETLILKYSARCQIKSLLRDKEVYNKWRNTYPELEKEYLKDKGISLKRKISYLLSYLRIEPCYRPVYNLLTGK